MSSIAGETSYTQALSQALLIDTRAKRVDPANRFVIRYAWIQMQGEMTLDRERIAVTDAASLNPNSTMTERRLAQWPLHCLEVPWRSRL